MIAKVFLLFLIQYNYRSLSAIENQFCDNSYKDSLLALGGIFSIDGTYFATRRYPNTDQTIVWKFKLKVTDSKPKLKGNKFEIIDMSSHEIKSLFPGLMFDYFVSGFAITDTNSCGDKSEECVNTSHMKNLTVILGPNSSGKQSYAVYRFDGNSFKAVDPKTEALPLALKAKGTTTHWFSPKAFITTTFRHKQKQIIGFNYGDKTINKLELKRFTDHKIWNRYWDIMVSNILVESFSYHLIELKVTETQREVLLITQQMVYQMIDDKRLEKMTTPWHLFGCKSVKTPKISLRSGLSEDMGGPKHNLTRTPVKLDEYENLSTTLTIELILANILYIIAVVAILFSIYKSH